MKVAALIRLMQRDQQQQTKAPRQGLIPLESTDRHSPQSAAGDRVY